jgi:hypothetical protein
MEIHYIFEFYKKICGYSIIQRINKEINEDEKNYLIEVIKVISSHIQYFAEKINKAIKDKNEKIILRIIIWGLGIGDWAQSPIPNPQSPIPNPH